MTKGRDVSQGAPSPDIRNLLDHARFVRGLARHLVHDRHGADEVVQETWLRALRSPPGRVEGVRAWLSTVTRRVAGMRYRGDVRRRRREGAAARAEETAGPDETVAKDELFHRVSEAVLSLTPGQREVVLLRYYEGLAPRGIAARLDLPIDAVRSRLRRALAKLRSRLDRSCGQQAWRPSLAALVGLPAVVARSAGGPATFSAGGAIAGTAAKAGMILLAVVVLAGVGLWQVTRNPDDALDDEHGTPAKIAEGSGATDPDVQPPPLEATPFVVPGEGESAPAPVVPPGVDVQVLDPLGVPVAGVRVAVCDATPRSRWSAGSHPELHPTDEDGRVRVPLAGPEKKDRRVIAVAPGWPPVQAPVGSGVVVLRLAEGESIGGRVRVGGAPPGYPVEVVLEGYKDPSVEWTGQLKDPLKHLGYGNGKMKVATSPDGAFSFHGLQAGRVVLVSFPTHRVAGETNRDHHTIEVRPPSKLVVDLEELPFITGRPVGSGSESLALEVVATVFRADGTSYELKTGCRIDQPFRLVLVDRNASTAEVVIQQTDGPRFARRLLATGLDDDVALGDIPREEMRRWEFVVTDVAGMPLAAARAATEGHQSEPTGADGKGVLAAPLLATALTVGAPGYRITSVPLDPALEGPVRVTLQRANALRVVVTTSNGKPPVGLEVRLTFGKGGLFEREIDAFRGFAAVRGTSACGASMNNFGSGTFHYPVGKDGVILYGLLPDTRFKIELTDRHQNVLISDHVSVGRTERRQVDWKTLTHAHSLDVTILDENDRPLEGGSVRLDSHFMRWEVNADGAVTFDDIYKDTVSLTVTGPGYVTQAVSDVRLDGSPHVFRMKRSRTVWVEVIDEAGDPVRKASVALVIGGEVRGRASAPAPNGLYRMDGVPREAGMVRVSGRTGELVEVSIGAQTDELKVTLR